MQNPNRIVSPTHTAVVGHDQHGWPARENELKELMGLKPKAKWPDHGMSSRQIQGIWVWVESKTEAATKKHFHRAHAECPQCGWIGSVGRLAQHVCK